MSGGNRGVAQADLLLLPCTGDKLQHLINLQNSFVLPNQIHQRVHPHLWPGRSAGMRESMVRSGLTLSKTYSQPL